MAYLVECLLSTTTPYLQSTHDRKIESESKTRAHIEMHFESGSLMHVNISHLKHLRLGCVVVIIS